MKILPLLALWLSVLAAFACQKQVEKPSLSNDKIAEIMADLSLAEAAMHTMGSGPTKDSLMQVYVGQVFKIHQTSLDEYEKNLQLTCRDISQMALILDKSEEIVKTKSGQTGTREKAKSLGQN